MAEAPVVLRQNDQHLMRGVDDAAVIARRGSSTSPDSGIYSPEVCSSEAQGASRVPGQMSEGSCQTALNAVKRILEPVQMRLMSDFDICPPDAYNRPVPLIEMLADNMESYLDETYYSMLKMEGRNGSDMPSLAVRCEQCGKNCFSHDVLEVHISEMHNPFLTANSSNPPQFKCPVSYCAALCPSPAERQFHVCLYHGFLASSPIFTVLQQTPPTT